MYHEQLTVYDVDVVMQIGRCVNMATQSFIHDPLTTISNEKTCLPDFLVILKPSTVQHS